MVSYPIIGGEVDYNDPTGFCAGTAEQPRVTAARVLREVKRIPLPKPAVSIQPPGGRTLVNFDTIFSTTAEPISRQLRIAGIPVEIRIEPSSYAWDFGDGEQATTDHPGRVWTEGVAMSEYLTHMYADADVIVRPSVRVVYAAEFRVRQGAWQAVPGTVSVQGPPAELRVVEARPVLVAPQ